MPFCSYCGKEAAPDARFCSGCGSPLGLTDEAVVPAPAEPVVTAVPNAAGPAEADYGLVLYSIGTCAKSYADDVLEDILGYSDSEAKQIIKTLPAQIAQYLTMEQAQYIAQALTEYGMQVAVFKGQNAVDLSQYATKSVFNSDGSFVAGALAALATLTVTNRIRSICRWSLSNLLSGLFRPRYRWEPPRHVTRAPIRREPEPVRITPPRSVSMPRRLEQKPRGMSGGIARGAARGNAGGRGPSGGTGGGRGRR